MARPNFEREFILECDASKTGLGSVLLQRDENHTPHVIAYASRTLIASERNFSVTRLELLSIIWSIRRFRCYIEGDHFKIITDHYCLQWMSKLQNPSSRLARWSLELQQYEFTVEHKRGSLHVFPDCLSRMYEEEDSIEITAVEISKYIKDKWYLERYASVQKSPKGFRYNKIVNGLLYYYRPNPRIAALTDEDDEWKLFVPKDDRKRVLAECHEEKQSSHL